MAAEAAKTKSNYFPLGGEPAQGAHKATATCFCGSVQLLFPTEGDDLIDTFICNCTDCRKITASMFASNFIVNQSSVSHVRGKNTLTSYSQSATIDTGNTMTNSFCSKCGTLMYRVSSGFPDKYVMRIGTVDDFNLHETKLKPRIEQFGKDRVSWCTGGDGVKQEEGNYFTG